jgi:hypothetical protein
MPACARQAHRAADDVSLHRLRHPVRAAVPPPCGRVGRGLTGAVSSRGRIRHPPPLLDPAAAWLRRQHPARHARRLRTPRPAASPSRPAPPTAIATPGRWASTASRTIGVWVGRPDGAPSRARRSRGCGADPVRRLRRTGKLPATLPAAPKARSSPRPASCRRRCSASVPALLAGEAPSRSFASCSRPTARARACERRPRKPDPIALKGHRRRRPLTVLVNGSRSPIAPGRRTLFFEPNGPASCASPSWTPRVQPTALW